MFSDGGTGKGIGDIPNPISSAFQCLLLFSRSEGGTALLQKNKLHLAKEKWLHVLLPYRLHRESEHLLSLPVYSQSFRVANGKTLP